MERSVSSSLAGGMEHGCDRELRPVADARWGLHVCACMRQAHAWRTMVTPEESVVGMQLKMMKPVTKACSMPIDLGSFNSPKATNGVTTRMAVDAYLFFESCVPLYVLQCVLQCVLRCVHACFRECVYVCMPLYTKGMSVRRRRNMDAQGVARTQHIR